jgi:hypothetical protein
MKLALTSQGIRMCRLPRVDLRISVFEGNFFGVSAKPQQSAEKGLSSNLDEFCLDESLHSNHDASHIKLTRLMIACGLNGNKDVSEIPKFR